ncbi:uncharacterized protein LOC143193881 [Rhynchophorus ferrugineus]|uniref:uncharacterized protein LOC143193881 n=1 Tax=Rhynchophorus ferrugineus TaxID=354439 RepID=UPI003FCC3616
MLDFIGNPLEDLCGDDELVFNINYDVNVDEDDEFDFSINNDPNEDDNNDVDSASTLNQATENFVIDSYVLHSNYISGLVRWEESENDDISEDSSIMTGSESDSDYDPDGNDDDEYIIAELSQEEFE